MCRIFPRRLRFRWCTISNHRKSTAAFRQNAQAGNLQLRYYDITKQLEPSYRPNIFPCSEGSHKYSVILSGSKPAGSYWVCCTRHALSHHHHARVTYSACVIRH
ncbi:hypothetical protein CEXT_29921 [Caerostris extrusa]|uniref:Uncharacterized protein n=1 Tax=Caerostris extrusa TaxID=172846 RepID=A0AAV4YBH2_CAEEX|nr:hypothetical protein CEXT_29921 [Caerostris extrusa]